MKASALFGGIGRALSNPVYRLFWFSNSLSSIGRWMHRMAVGWLTWELTESTAWLGIVAFADTFPLVLFSILAGAIADQAGSVRVMRFSQLASGCVTALFAALTLGGVITIEMVLILTVFFGSFESLSTPPRMALVHALVPRRDLSAAIALGSATYNAARMIGPAIAGALILWASVGAVIALGSLTFFQFYVALLFIRTGDSGERRKVSPGALLGDIKMAMLYVIAHPGIRFLMLILGITGLVIRPYIEMLPGVSAQMFGSGPDGLALLLSSIGFGAVCSGLWLAQRGETAGLTRLVTASLLAGAVALILFTLSGHIWLAAAFLVLAGFAMLVGGIGSQTLIQNVVDSAMRARVMSLFGVLSFGMPALGALVMGWVAAFAGLAVTIAGGAALALIAWLWARRLAPRLAPDLERMG